MTAPVVQEVDSAIHRKANCTVLGIEIYPVVLLPTLCTTNKTVKE